MAINLSKSFHYPSVNLREMERQLIELALRRNQGNRKAAASELGITERTLYRRLREFNMHKVVPVG